MMKMATLVKKQRDRCRVERRELFRQALEEAGWTYQRAGELIGMTTSGVQMAVVRDPILFAEYQKKAERAGVGGRPPA